MSVLKPLRVIVRLCIAICISQVCFPQGRVADTTMRKIDREVFKLMREGEIPGLSLVLVRGGQQVIKSYGYADPAQKKPVTSATLFEIGSCTKAFTALAFARLVQQGKVALDDDVARYIPGFRVVYKGKPATITLRHLLHHTSGIPWRTISEIPQSNDADALRQTVGQLAGQKLNHLPGKEYEYATINYDVLALVIQNVTGQPFEHYLNEQVIRRLQLPHTTIGTPGDRALLATGHKVSFFEARPYDAPVFRGNNAAGYVISDARDMARWLQFQLGLSGSELYGLAKFTHRRDETVPLHGMNAYAMGWEVSLSGNGEIHHGGLNPNYSSYVTLRPRAQLGVAVLTNANSSFTPAIADRTMKLLAGEEIEKHVEDGNQLDKTFTIVSLILAAYVLSVLAFLAMTLAEIVTGRRKYERPAFRKLGQLLGSLLIALPFLFGLFILPRAMLGFSWESMVVWGPVSLPSAAVLILAALGVSYCAYFTGLLYPQQNKIKEIVPKVLLFSILSGLANMVVIMMVTTSLDSDVEWKYLVYYYGLTLAVYLLGRRYVQNNLIRFSRELTFEQRRLLIEKILATSFQRFEKVDRGRIFTAVNDDVDTIGGSTNMFVMLVTNFITTIGAFLYLAAIAFWASMVTVALILLLVTIYFVVIRNTNKYFEEARDTRNVFMHLLNGMIEGFKEISLKRRKKREYEADIIASARAYKEKISTASVRFVDASLVGETVLVVLLGGVVFAFPEVFPEIKTHTLMSFVVVLLYLIGPINTILGSVPSVLSLRIAWNRVQQFLAEIPVTADAPGPALPAVPATVDVITAEGVQFEYKNGPDQEHFAVGPIDLEVKKGEILFVIGGNGSGKTTLAKLLTGLYTPDKGHFKINGKPVEPGRLGEYFSTVFSPTHLFEKLYNIRVAEKSEEAKKYLELLNLEKKVEIKGNRYSTINLSSGQRKRLALLQCYLEDSPIYLFDEWAADQDPEYRRFFYWTLLPQMREMGKIVIAITHDDHYFHLADRVLRMNQGKLEVYGNDYMLSRTDPLSGRL